MYSLPQILSHPQIFRQRSRYWYATIINRKSNYDRFVPASIGDTPERDEHHNITFICR